MSNSADKPATSGAVSETPKENKQIKDLKAKIAELEAKLDSIKPSESPAAKAPRTAMFAELHNQIFLPTIGQLPKSMDCSPSSQQPKLRGLKMLATDYGLEVTLRNRTGFIPWGNVAWCVFEVPSKEEAKKLDANAGPNTVAPGYHGPSKLGTATVTSK